MTVQVTFQGTTKLIEIDSDTGDIELDITRDIYSAWKLWVNQSPDNSKFLPALRTIGGDPTVGVKKVAPYYFLTNGWKIKPMASYNHTITLSGNLFIDSPEDYGYNVFIAPDDPITVLINMSTTSDATLIVSGSGVTEQDKQDIANLVDQSSVLAKEATVEYIKRFSSGKWKIANNQLTIYGADGVTPLAIFNLFNKDGVPSMTAVTERTPAP